MICWQFLFAIPRPFVFARDILMNLACLLFGPKDCDIGPVVFHLPLLYSTAFITYHHFPCGFLEINGYKSMGIDLKRSLFLEL